MKELSDDEREGRTVHENVFDFSDESEGEEERIIHDNHSSDSELSGDEDDETQTVSGTSDFGVYFGQGKHSETHWLSTPLVFPSSRTPSKNIVKIFPGPTRNARNSKSELEVFLNFISFDIIDKIMEYTNIYIEKKISTSAFSRDRDCKITSRSEIMALFGILYILSINKSCKADARRA